MDKTHWKKKFNYDYLGSYSITDGNDLILTIKEVKTEKVTGDKGRKEDCLIVHFKEDVKPMILNRTNCKAIEKAHKTAFIEDWKGKSIAVYVKDGIEAFGDVVEALRVRPYKPTLSLPELTKAHKSWMKVVKYLSEDKSINDVEKKYTISADVREQLLDEAMSFDPTNEPKLM
jgi:hypothetical protein